MKLTRAHVIKLDPNREQETYFRRACGIRRWVYNWALGEWRAWWMLYQKTAKRPGHMSLQKFFNRIKDDVCPWVRDVSSRIPERAIRDAGAAYTMWFKAMQRGDTQWGRPRFARRGGAERFYVHNESLRFDDKRVFIQRCRWVRCREELRFPTGRVLGATVSKKADGYFLSVQVEIETADPVEHQGPPVGIDAGIAQNFALSTGGVLDLPRRELMKLDRQIKRAQRCVSRRWGGRLKTGREQDALRDENGKLMPRSNRFQKAVARVSRLKQKQARIRAHYLHRFSKQIVENHATICVEDLAIRQMTRSARGDAETPGTNVSAKAGLNREMLNVAMSAFRWMLEYKSEPVGGTVIPVAPQYTSQTCSECGHVDAESRPTQSRFRCTSCGHESNADLNAAKVILQKGIEA